MEQTDIHKQQKIVFEYSLTKTGTAMVALKTDKQKFTTEISYLRDPLSDLLDGLLNVSPFYHKSLYLSKGPVLPYYTVNWVGETISHDMCLRPGDNGMLDIIIRSFKVSEKKPVKEIVFAETCSYDVFLETVINALTELLHLHGIVGYYDTWAGNSGFPFANFIKLRHYLATGKLYKSRLIKFQETPEKYYGRFCTSLKKDLSFIIQKKQR